jgi:hypothetical protein
VLESLECGREAANMIAQANGQQRILRVVQPEKSLRKTEMDWRRRLLGFDEWRLHAELTAH